MGAASCGLDKSLESISSPSETVDPTFTENLKPTNTSTPTETPTPTPTPTMTPTSTETPTPTEAPLEVFYNFSGIESGNWKLGEHLNEIPTISLEDITSGRLLKREKQLMEEGKISPFTEATIPPDSMYYYNNGSLEGIWPKLPDFVMIIPDVSDYLLDHPEAVPFRLLSLSFVDVGETRLLVYGVAFLNPDKSISILHFAFENYKDPFVLNMISALANFKINMGPLVSVSPAFDTAGVYFLYDYNRYESYMINTYYRNEEEVQKRRTLCQQWSNENKAPEEMEKMLFLSLITPWNPFRQRDIKP